MAKQGKKYLETLVNSIICIQDAFRIHVKGDKYIWSAIGNQTLNDYFAVATIYDTIVDLDKKIKYSFREALECDLPETLDGYDPFSKLKDNEFVAMYHIENMVYRESILWDLLAQLCNIIFATEMKAEKIYYNKYFARFSSGDNAIEIVKEIKNYIDEVEDASVDKNPWLGNHVYLNDFRNQMTHRNAPSISSMSLFGSSLRPPAMYLLHRVTEDYYMVSSFLCKLINDFLEKYKDWDPFKSLDLGNQNE